MREIVPLPEIIPLEETPAYVVGVVNLRGRIVPVIDLNLRFGHLPQPCRMEDCVVVLEWAGSAFGIIVDTVQNVHDIAQNEIAPIPSYGGEARVAPQFLTGLVKLGEQVVMLLHLESLLCLSQSPKERRGTGESDPRVKSNAFCSDATPEEKAVFRERALSLAQPPEDQDQAGLLPIALVRLSDELFGIDLQVIREFVELRNVTPVPCCPEHIVGQMNLRGDIITLIDIADALGLPPTRGRSGRKVVVVNNVEMGAGVLVDEVLDVLYLRAADVAPATAGMPGQEYLRGTAPYESKMLTLLDLPALLLRDSLIVNEKP